MHHPRDGLHIPRIAKLAMTQLDVADLRDFYATPLGQMVRRSLARRVRRRWPSVRGQTLIGLGYAAPYLGSFRTEARHLGALMPLSQGALVWPQEGKRLSALVEEDKLPLVDSSVDRLLAVHSLEAAERVSTLLREIWRVLSPEGRLLLVLPNRRGIWARTDATPFGHGRPYSRGQIDRLLRDALFTPLHYEAALFMPPIGHRMMLRWSGALERLGDRLTPVFAGVIIVEASKELVAPTGKLARSRAIGGLVSVTR